MPSNAAIFLTLVAGFIFIGLFDLTRYVAQSWNGPRLVFGAGAFGTGLLFLGKAALHIPYVLPCVQWMSKAATTGNGSEIPPQVVMALVVAVVLAVLLNVATSKDMLVATSRKYGGDPLLVFLGREFEVLADAAKATQKVEKEVLRAKKRRGKRRAAKTALQRWRDNRAARRATKNALVAKKHSHTIKARLVQLTMNDNKVYVGYVVSRPGPGLHEAYFQFFPTLSGYRETESRKVFFTTNYWPLIEHARRKEYPLSPDDLQILLPAASVASARVFDPAAYVKHFDEESPVAGWLDRGSDADPEDQSGST